ncbi:F-box/LRR-repeat protein 18, partial [Orchesella cincta]
ACSIKHHGGCTEKLSSSSNSLQGSTHWSLGDETLLHMVQYLHGPDFDHGDLVNLALTCKRFEGLLQDRSVSEVIKLVWSLKASRDALVGYLRQRNRAELVTKLHITDLYWVPSGVLRDAVIQMHNLQELLAAGARLSWTHLKEVLTTLDNIEGLSWSWDSGLEETIRREGSVSPDWKRLSMFHPNIKEINLSKNEGVVYPDYCVALAHMTKLKRISIPVEALVEIKDAKILSEFADCVPPNDNSTSNEPQSYTVGFKNDELDREKFLIEPKRLHSNPYGYQTLDPLGVSYITDLSEAVRHCPQLKDLRLQQNYMGSVTSLLHALQNCSNLQRILLWSSPNDTALDAEAVLSLFTKCKNLVVFYAVIEPTLKIVCKKLRKILTDKYKFERPPLSIFIETSLEDDRIPTYPSVHLNQLVINSSQVCHYNNFPMFDVL